MEVAVEMRDGVAVLAPRGEMDQSGLPHISKEVARLLGEGVARFVFDLGGLTFVDSMGSAYLLMTCKRARERGGDVVLVSIPRIVRRTFEILGMLEVFRVFDDSRTAVDHLRARP